MSNPPIFTDKYVQFPSVTSTERDALTAVNGMIIYNTTLGAFQKYEAGVWVSLGAGTAIFVDSSFNIVGSSDATKVMRFEVDGNTTGTTRVYTMPDYDATLATLAGAEAFSNKAITASSLIATALSLLIGGFKAIFTHINTADRTYTFQDQSGTVQLNALGNRVQNSSFEVWERGTSAAPDGWVLTGASATVAREGTLINHGLYSAKVTRVGTNCHLSTDIYALYGGVGVRGKQLTLGAWVYATSSGKVRLRVNDGTTTFNSAYHSGGSSWEWLQCPFTVGGSATALNIGLAVDTGDTSGYIDGVTVTEGLSAPNYTPAIREFNQFPKRATLWHDEAIVTVGNALLNALNVSQIYALYVFQSTAALNDAFTQSFWLAAGTYTFSALGVTSTTAGQIDWYIDGVKVVTLQDWYVASPAFNVVKTATVTVIGDGWHQLKGIVSAKNVSSGGYNLNLTKYWFRPSAD